MPVLLMDARGGALTLVDASSTFPATLFSRDTSPCLCNWRSGQNEARFVLPFFEKGYF